MLYAAVTGLIHELSWPAFGFLLTGAAIYAAVMELFGFPVLRVSTRGLRFAAVMEDIS